MARVVGKGKEKGTAFGKVKSKIKLKRKQELEAKNRRIEMTKKNNENKKIKEAERQKYEEVKNIKFLDFVKGYLIILKDDKKEKRAVKYPKGFRQSELDKMDLKCFVTLEGDNFNLGDLKISHEIMGKIRFYLEDTLN